MCAARTGYGRVRRPGNDLPRQPAGSLPSGRRRFRADGGERVARHGGRPGELPRSWWARWCSASRWRCASAPGYVAAFTRASNAVYGIGEGRPLWKLLPVRPGVTAVLVFLLAVSAVIVVFTGDRAAAGDVLGVGRTTSVTELVRAGTTG
jgi:hypothetical protein